MDGEEWGTVPVVGGTAVSYGILAHAICCMLARQVHKTERRSCSGQRFLLRRGGRTSKPETPRKQTGKREVLDPRHKGSVSAERWGEGRQVWIQV